MRCTFGRSPVQDSPTALNFEVPPHKRSKGPVCIKEPLSYYTFPPPPMDLDSTARPSGMGFCRTSGDVVDTVADASTRPTRSSQSTPERRPVHLLRYSDTTHPTLPGQSNSRLRSLPTRYPDLVVPFQPILSRFSHDDQRYGILSDFGGHPSRITPTWRRLTLEFLLNPPASKRPRFVLRNPLSIKPSSTTRRCGWTP
ncbi:hypothetical protein FNV43_RR16797 [Rhamnella rubrinervis]|uniref:Uncharacterized protein n=1 Tax=Rhamnella rubrinervis TaxID=2594499 RepID=A0A8K0MCL4_9ROSA|nr:hypothetical protein FNV43_RR16797 [Rhamnella rubrinervis]